MEMLERFRNKYLRIIVNTPWYVALHYSDLNRTLKTRLKDLAKRCADKSQSNTPIKKKSTSRFVCLCTIIL